jgi:hypothetical protein
MFTVDAATTRFTVSAGVVRIQIQGWVTGGSVRVLGHAAEWFRVWVFRAKGFGVVACWDTLRNGLGFGWWIDVMGRTQSPAASSTRRSRPPLAS